ncbi:plasminogen receptor (KT) isoform X4 [Betta splendens]|uniref:Plasminogen receptor (KT) isoform X4 n=1 Tax=Betta splendens TaxID=158456 RepID=A0A9W2Y5R8_BETSP|nr:plasminogen receptor (KT) isoform X4 [Betta splendens]
MRRHEETRTRSDSPGPLSDAYHGATDPDAESDAGAANGHADRLVQRVPQILCAVKRRKPALFAPVIPLGFIFAYQMDSAYGTLIHRIRGEAETILVSEQDRLELPHGTPTFESIEKARRAKSSLSSLLEK